MGAMAKGAVHIGRCSGVLNLTQLLRLLASSPCGSVKHLFPVVFDARLLLQGLAEVFDLE